ncbi:MAG TPA: hypothetical protein VMJ73_02940 [Rhizomicrobium sp.]|jgi:hypothetical protein|nr:hypothetical protein [Rhizomicrobium sp.]
MIVWSKGLGKQRLPLELPDATLRATQDDLVMEGTIEPVCWRYAIRLAPDDLSDFLKLLAEPQTARFLAEKPGVLLPFVFGLIAIVPRLLFKMLTPKKRPSPVAG